MIPILGLLPKEFGQKIESVGQPKYRARQVLHAIFQERGLPFEEMKNLPKDFRQFLAQNFSLPSLKVQHLVSKDGTQKFCFELRDGKKIESVWMPEEKRNTLCISSQVGCGMGCKFCVTGTLGFQRDLTTEEVVQQVWYVKGVKNLPVSNVVFMGMGEPLLNRSAIEKAIEIFSSPEGFKIGRRKITVSTVGILPVLVDFVEKNRVKLAISLTGGVPSTIEKWMPIHKKYKVEQLLQMLKKIPLQKGQRFMFEVVLISNQTDSLEDALGLSQWLRKIPSKVNLIPYNENSIFPDLKTPSNEKVEIFRSTLAQFGIHSTIRKNRGMDIMGACGQLGYSVLHSTKG